LTSKRTYEDDTVNGQRSRRGWVGAVVALTLVGGGCASANGDKAGGAVIVPHVLTLANGDADDSIVESFAKAVATLSSGTLVIDIHNGWGATDLQQEGDLIKDVEAGKADLGVGLTRSFDTVGINNFEALQAPFLIDTYVLEQKVLSSSIAAQMLDGLGAAGLVGLAIVPGPMRRLLGRSRALVTLADIRGATIGIRPSHVTEKTLEALGATPVVNAAGGPISTLDGIESHLYAIEGNRYDAGAAALTANVNLWPRASVIFANANVFGGLSAEQQGWLREAGSQAAMSEMPAVLQTEAAEGAILCRRNLRFVFATATDLSDLRQAVAPVYRDLNSDAATKALIDQIEAMRVGSDASPDAAPACLSSEPSPTASASAGPATPIDGTWEVTITQAEFLAAKPPPHPDEIDPSNWGYGTMDLHAGRWFMGPGGSPSDVLGGTFVVTGNKITLDANDGNEFEATWSIYKDRLTFGIIAGFDLPNGWRVKPWDRVGP